MLSLFCIWQFRTQRLDKKHQRCPKNVFSPFVTPKIFLKHLTLSFWYPYGALTSYKKLEKTNRQSLKYLKADQKQTNSTDQRIWLHRSPFDKTGSIIRTTISNYRDKRSFWKSGFVNFLTLLYSDTVWKVWKFVWLIFIYSRDWQIIRVTDRQASLHRTSTWWVKKTYFQNQALLVFQQYCVL